MNNNNATIDKMKAMRLHGMAETFRNILETGNNAKLTNDEIVALLIDSEYDYKHNRKLQRLIKAARFRCQACQYGYSVGYYSGSRLFAEIKMSKSEGTYIKLINKIVKHSVLIIDDFGLEKLDDSGRMAFLEIIEEFHRRKSVIIVAQIPVSKWHEIIGDPTIADAIMDRIVYNSHRIELKGDSLRRKMYEID